MTKKAKIITGVVAGVTVIGGIGAITNKDKLPSSEYLNTTTGIVFESTTVKSIETTIDEIITTTQAKQTETEKTKPDNTVPPKTSNVITTSKPLEIITQAPIVATDVATMPPAPVKTDPPKTEPSISDKIILISFNSMFKRNEDASITIQGKPNTEYTIKVYYSSGASKAEGLENKTSDSNGLVSWTWHVGGKTNLGDNKRLVISGGNEKFETNFSVVA